MEGITSVTGKSSKAKMLWFAKMILKRTIKPLNLPEN